MKKMVKESLNEMQPINEGILDTKLSRIKEFLREKADEYEVIIGEYEENEYDDISQEEYNRAEAQLEIVVQIMDMLDMP